MDQNGSPSSCPHGARCLRTASSCQPDGIPKTADDREEGERPAVKTGHRADSTTMSLEGKDHLLSDDGEASPELLPGKWQPEWFAAYTMSRHEKRIASHCERIGIEPFLPLFTSQRSWKNRTTIDLEMPLFPNYLFVRLLPQDHGPLMRLPGLLSIVGNALGPVVIPDGDMELLRRVIAFKSIAPHPLLTTGDKVRVTAGPLAGLIGFV